MAVRMLKKQIDAATRFFGELKRRKVIKVMGVYAVVAWIVIQIATNTFPALQLPPWAITLVVVLAILGFPIAVVVAWAFDITPTGIRADRSTHETPPVAAPTPHSSRGPIRSGPALPRPARAGSIAAAPVEDDAALP